MTTLTGALSLASGGVAAFVGCGGKTTLVALLAEENRHKSVLITPTTKMLPMQGSVGVYQAETGKLTSLPPEALARIVPMYDLALLEADGSRGLPLKGWRAYEPVVPPYCTHTIGVVTLAALGCPVTEENCLRLPEFERLTGIAAGETVTIAALTRMVCGAEGMFRQSAGAEYLVVNAVEDEAAEAHARALLRGIRAAYPGRFTATLYGSAHQNRWEIVTG